MTIAIIAHDNKKEILREFCFAYRSVLAEHTLCATNGTGRVVMDATGLPVKLCLAGDLGGRDQIAARVAYDEIDLVLFFCDPKVRDYAERIERVARACDERPIPFATNIAAAEALVLALRRGDLDWRDVLRVRKDSIY